MDAVDADLPVDVDLRVQAHGLAELLDARERERTGKSIFSENH